MAEALEFRKAFAFRCSAVGASPSGKAVDFDSTIRRFESSRPSQAFQRRAGLAKKREIRPEIGAFNALGFVSRLPIRRSSGANCRKSPPTSANIPVLRRLRPETWFDLHCVGDRAVLSTVFSSHLFVKSGVSKQLLHDDRSMSSNPPRSATINLLAVPSAKVSKIPRFLPKVSSERIWRAASAALDRGWRMHFSP